MIKKIFYLLSSLVLINAHDYNLCDSNNLITIDSINLNPDPPQVGKDLVVDIHFNTNVDITKATGEMDIKKFGINIAKVNFDICQENQCPILKNTQNKISITKNIPKDVPAGIKVNTETVITSNNTRLVCVNLDTTVDKPSIENILYYLRGIVNVIKQN